MLIAIIGWLVLVLITVVFAGAALFWFSLWVVFRNGSASECLVAFIFFGLLAAAFGYGAWVNAPIQVSFIAPH